MRSTAFSNARILKPVPSSQLRTQLVSLIANLNGLSGQGSNTADPDSNRDRGTYWPNFRPCFMQSIEYPLQENTISSNNVKQQVEKVQKPTSRVHPYLLSTIFPTFPSGIHPLYLFLHLLHLQEHLNHWSHQIKSSIGLEGPQARPTWGMSPDCITEHHFDRWTLRLCQWSKWDLQEDLQFYMAQQTTFSLVFGSSKNLTQFKLI